MPNETSLKKSLKSPKKELLLILILRLAEPEMFFNPFLRSFVSHFHLTIGKKERTKMSKGIYSEIRFLLF